MIARIISVVLLVLWAAVGTSRGQAIDLKMHHLRHGEEREWAEFAENAEGSEWRWRFEGKANGTERTLRVRHRDVRQVWGVSMNGKEVGKLPLDENAMVSVFAIPPGVVVAGENVVRVWCTSKGKEADDVVVGDVALIDRARQDILGEAGVQLSVVDEETGKGLPARVTIVDERGSFVPLGTESGRGLAVRPGVVYTATGVANVRLPAGTYTVYAGRGFEWGLATAKVEARVGEVVKLPLSIRREVETRGWVACDTHVHTWTYSRHGDATLAERMVTLAGEGIELPVATDHNLQIDYEEAANDTGVRQWFTPVVGNEVTTPKLGHFNVFPIAKGAKLIDFRVPTWEKVFERIDEVAPGAVVVLNHARDLHGGFRPFDPMRHFSVSGEDLEGQVLRANAMEVLNSGATLNDPLLLYRDWMGCWNHGTRLTPIGASDSHDVSRFIVGQGRTYVRCDDSDPGKIDVKAAVEAIKAGRVNVSYGLLTEIVVDGRFGPGDLAPLNGEANVEVTVKGPRWTVASRVELYANGRKIAEAEVPVESGRRAGVKFGKAWKVAGGQDDLFLSAVAVGPGVTGLYWPGAKPYQSTGERWTPCVMGSTGAVMVDVDRSGGFESAYDNARKIVGAVGGDVGMVTRRLEGRDPTVAVQAAGLLRVRGVVRSAEELEEATKGAPAGVREAWGEYARDWRGRDRG